MAASPAGGGPLGDEELLHFRERGWCVLRGAVPREEAVAFTRDVLLPAVKAAGVDPDSPETWHTGEKYHALWNRALANSNRYGAHVGLGEGAVLPPSPLFAAGGLLRRAAEQLLGTDAAGAPRFVPRGEGNRFGSVVVRYPMRRRSTGCWGGCWPCGRQGIPVLGWHLDGVYHHHLHSRGVALITLPVFGLGTVGRGCGMTAVASGSQELAADWLAASHPRGLSHPQLFLRAHLLAWSAWLPACLRCLLLGRRAGALRLEEAAPCEPGDVLLMHPFLVHSSSENVRGDDLRLAFNVGDDLRLAFNVGLPWTGDLDLGRFWGPAGCHPPADSIGEVERVHVAAILRRARKAS